MAYSLKYFAIGVSILICYFGGSYNPGNSPHCGDDQKIIAPHISPAISHPTLDMLSVTIF